MDAIKGSGFAQSSSQPLRVHWGPVVVVEVETSEGVGKFTCNIECDFCGGRQAKKNMKRAGKLTWFCPLCAPGGEAIIAMGLCYFISWVERVVNGRAHSPLFGFPASRCDTGRARNLSVCDNRTRSHKGKWDWLSRGETWLREDKRALASHDERSGCLVGDMYGMPQHGETYDNGAVEYGVPKNGYTSDNATVKDSSIGAWLFVDLLADDSYQMGEWGMYVLSQLGPQALYCYM